MKSGGDFIVIVDDDMHTGLLHLKKYIVAQRIPINATIFLTNKCNFRCLHCYVQSQKNDDEEALNVEQWKNILGVLKERGCLYITFTGGEALVSEKFYEVYSYAYDLNFRITLMTNISLLKNKHLELFKEKPPYCITVTLYGTSDNTYEEFCGVNNIWNTVKRNILLLKKNNIIFKIQTVLNRINYPDLVSMKEFADEYEIPFRVYRNMKCEIDGNSRPLQYQVSIQQEIESYEILGDIQDYLNAVEQNKAKWKEGYKRCFAGITNCYIDCKGNMFLCNQSCDERFSILKNGFDVAWRNIYEVRKREIEVYNECVKCNNKELCGKCAPTYRKMNHAIGFPFPDCHKIEIMKRYLAE